MPAKTKRQRKPKTKKKIARPQDEIKLPAATDWRTSDSDERNRRLLRALDEKPKIKNLTPEHPVYSNFDVQSPSGMTYEVELRSIEPRRTYCTCTDFRINGLGTCKHVEAVILYLQSRLRKRAYNSAVDAGSDRVDVIVDFDRQTLQVDSRRSLRGVLGRLFGTDRRLATDISIEEALETLASCKVKGLRISRQVSDWYEHHHRSEENLALRRSYEQRVQRGKYSGQETKVPLYPYQREGMLHLAFGERAMVADEMGLGKTIQAIAACALLHRLGQANRVLIVAPASLKTEWEEQITQFTDLSYQIVYGPKLKRLSAYQNRSPFFTLVNYEQIRPDALDINEYLQADIVVLDEAQRIKNWNTLTARSVKRLKSRYAFVLTGTPIENRIDELYSIVDFLDPSVLGPLFRFNRRYYEFDDRGRPSDYCNLGELHERVKPVMLRRLKRDVEAELPERTDRNHFVEMSKTQQSSYAYHSEIVAKLTRIAQSRPLRKEEQERLMRELAMMRMLCDTCYILDDKDKTCPKLEELDHILDEYLSEPEVKILIFSEWVRMLELIRERVIKKGIGYAWHTGSVPQPKRREEIRAFKSDPDCRVFLCSESGGVGLNLQNASVVINCDLPWNPAKLEQRIARAWRKHQKRAVSVINLVSRNTIEHGMLGTLEAKRDLAQGVLDLEGDLDKITLKGGGRAFVEKLDQVLTKVETLKAKEKKQKAAKKKASLLAKDPILAFASSCAESLTKEFVRCEEHFLQSDEPSVLIVIVKQLTPQVEEQIKRKHQALLQSGPNSGAQPTTLQIIDEHTAEAIQQLEKSGLLQSTTRAIRHLTSELGSEQRGLGAGELARAKQEMEEARKKVKMAHLLDGGGFSVEARAALIEAITHAARMLSIREGFPEPKDLADAFQPPLGRLWQGAEETVKRFIDDVDDDTITNTTILTTLRQVLAQPLE